MQRLAKMRVPMVEFAQSVPNLNEASQNLYELIKSANLTIYPDAAIRLARQRAVAVETSRGWRIAKEKQSHKIDVVVALGMAALGAVQGGINVKPPMIISAEVIAWASQRGPWHPSGASHYRPDPRYAEMLRHQGYEEDYIREQMGEGP